MGGPWLLALIAAAALVALVGLLHLCDHGGKGRPANLDCAAVLALPIAGALVLHLARFYPLDADRLNLFLLPATLLLFGIGLQALALRGRHLARRTRRLPWVPSRPYAGIVAALLVLLVLRVSVGPRRRPFFAGMKTRTRTRRLRCPTLPRPLPPAMSSTSTPRCASR